MPTTTLAYGDAPDQVVDVAWPDAPGPHPVLVLVHGGFWRQPYGKDLMDPLAADARARGWATANVEYRRVGGAGGWPTTLEDVAAAVDALATCDAPLDLDRVAVAGHSAGGHLAAWVASRSRLPDGAVGAAPRVEVRAAASQAGVVALAQAAEAGLGEGATVELLGGTPDEVPERYAVADPLALVPPPVPVLLVHARDDDRVPVAQSQAYADAAGPAAELELFDGDHFTVIDPADPSWDVVVAWLDDRCGGPGRQA